MIVPRAVVRVRVKSNPSFRFSVSSLIVKSNALYIEAQCTYAVITISRMYYNVAVIIFVYYLKKKS